MWYLLPPLSISYFQRTLSYSCLDCKHMTDGTSPYLCITLLTLISLGIEDYWDRLYNLRIWVFLWPEALSSIENRSWVWKKLSTLCKDPSILCRALWWRTAEIIYVTKLPRWLSNKKCIGNIQTSMGNQQKDQSSSCEEGQQLPAFLRRATLGRLG